jgi:hypothetical protein
MMDTEQPSAMPAEATADYQKTIRVKAHPETLFDALTTVTGLAAWWDTRHGIRRRRRRPADGDATELHFRHHGLTPELGCIGGVLAAGTTSSVPACVSTSK